MLLLAWLTDSIVPCSGAQALGVQHPTRVEDVQCWFPRSFYSLLLSDLNWNHTAPGCPYCSLWVWVSGYPDLLLQQLVLQSTLTWTGSQILFVNVDFVMMMFHLQDVTH